MRDSDLQNIRLLVNTVWKSLLTPHRMAPDPVFPGRNNLATPASRRYFENMLADYREKLSKLVVRLVSDPRQQEKKDFHNHCDTIVSLVMVQLGLGGVSDAVLHLAIECAKRDFRDMLVFSFGVLDVSGKVIMNHALLLLNFPDTPLSFIDQPFASLAHLLAYLSGREMVVLDPIFNLVFTADAVPMVLEKHLRVNGEKIKVNKGSHWRHCSQSTIDQHELMVALVIKQVRVNKCLLDEAAFDKTQLVEAEAPSHKLRLLCDMLSDSTGLTFCVHQSPAGHIHYIADINHPIHFRSAIQFKSSIVDSLRSRFFFARDKGNRRVFVIFNVNAPKVRDYLQTFIRPDRLALLRLTVSLQSGRVEPHGLEVVNFNGPSCTEAMFDRNIGFLARDYHIHMIEIDHEKSDWARRMGLVCHDTLDAFAKYVKDKPGVVAKGMVVYMGQAYTPEEVQSFLLAHDVQVPVLNASTLPYAASCDSVFRMLIKRESARQPMADEAPVEDGVTVDVFLRKGSNDTCLEIVKGSIRDEVASKRIQDFLDQNPQCWIQLLGATAEYFLRVIQNSPEDSPAVKDFIHVLTQQSMGVLSTETAYALFDYLPRVDGLVKALFHTLHDALSRMSTCFRRGDPSPRFFQQALLYLLSSPACPILFESLDFDADMFDGLLSSLDELSKRRKPDADIHGLHARAQQLLVTCLQTGVARLYRLGNASFKGAKYTDALKCYARGLVLYKQLADLVGDNMGEDFREMIRLMSRKQQHCDQRMKAEADYNRGTQFYREEAYTEALPCYSSSLQGFSGLYGGDHPLVSKVLWNMSSCCMQLGDNVRAFNYIIEVCQIRDRLCEEERPSEEKEQLVKLRDRAYGRLHQLEDLIFAEQSASNLSGTEVPVASHLAREGLFGGRAATEAVGTENSLDAWLNQPE